MISPARWTEDVFLGWMEDHREVVKRVDPICSLSTWDTYM